MKIAYVHDELLPTDDTSVEQLINTISGLVHGGAEGTLFVPRPLFAEGPSREELLAFYDVDALFEPHYLRSVFPSTRIPEKVGHALRALLSPALRGYDAYYTRNITFLTAGISVGLPMVYETYRPWPAQYPALTPLFKALMAAPNFLGAVMHSAYCVDAYRRIGVDEARLAPIHNGFDPRRFKPRLSTAGAREQLGINEQRPMVGYTGRISAGKGISIILEMARLRPEVVFMLVGSAKHGEIEREAEALDNVLVFPWQTYDRLPHYLFASDYLIIPPTLLALQKTRNTVLPIKLFQYLAAERVIIAPRAPDTAELLRHGENAYLVDPDDAEAACQGLDELLESTPLCERITRGAAETAANLTWDARSAKVLAFIEERLASNGRKT